MHHLDLKTALFYLAIRRLIIPVIRPRVLISIRAQQLCFTVGYNENS